MLTLLEEWRYISVRSDGYGSACGESFWRLNADYLPLKLRCMYIVRATYTKKLNQAVYARCQKTD